MAGANRVFDAASSVILGGTEVKDERGTGYAGGVLRTEVRAPGSQS